MPLELITVPCLKDNYAFLIHDAASGATAAVDVPEAGPITAALAARGWGLTDILITHHHGDHIDGVDALRAATGARVWGAAAGAHRLPRLDHAGAPEDRVTVCGEEARVIDVSGHTVGHVAWHFPASGLVFTGDSLMAAGCGRLFEGSAAQMWDSLQRLAALPDATVVCSGHEYTASNLRFALSLEPGNGALILRSAAVDDARRRGQPTVPSLLSEERATNPFLRADTPGMRAVMALPDAPAAQVFAAIRAAKDRF
ncbi:MAG TPA: hydroxyacylglutathione hydrolase [Paracoccaceae bacterium]|nr:hydroxyacylglutathione hydrolase [Paracoccaceae bacterium]